MDPKKNAPLIAAIAIPIFMILFVAGSILVPAMLVRPQHDFLYIIADRFGWIPQGEYRVEQGKLRHYPQSQIDNGAIMPTDPPPLFFVYDVSSKTKTQLTLEEAQLLLLDPNNLSDDGYRINKSGESDSESDNLLSALFGGGNRNAAFILSKGVASQVIDISDNYNAYDGYRDYTFLGWVLQ